MNYAILDNNGYIIASSKTGYAGKFFGTIQSGLMKQFKECNIYKQIIIYDYQGVCFQRFHEVANSGISTLLNVSAWLSIDLRYAYTLCLTDLSTSTVLITIFFFLTEESTRKFSEESV